jgi:putative ABC transport system permease protein
VGRLLLIGRLAARDLRRRPAEAALLLLAITAATATLTLGLALRDVTDKPYERTRAATAGPDVIAAVAQNPISGQPPDVTALKALAGEPGIAAHGGPYPVAQAMLEANGHDVLAFMEGRDTATARIDQPKSTQGGWIRDGGIVIEAGYADALGVEAGDVVTLKPIEVELRGREPSIRVSGAGRSFRVAGVAVTAATPPYPEPACLSFCVGDAGLVWATRADTLDLAGGTAAAQVLNLRLTDPAAAPAFVDRRLPRPNAQPAAGTPEPPILRSWQEVRDASGNLVSNQRRALMTGAWLLALLAVASVAVLVGGRMADQIRRVGLLKAVGGTPALVAAVLLAEYVLVALLAAAAGLVVGWLAAPLLLDATAGLLGAASDRSLSLSTIGLVTGVALAVAVAATFVPAVRAARTSTVRALADSARQPRRTGWLIALSRRLPVPMLLGMRIAARRPRRTVLAAASIAITVSGIVAALSAHAGLAGDTGARAQRLDDVLLAITTTLVLLAAVNAIFITWATALDARHASALARALGATPQQVAAGLSAAQVLPALTGAVLAIPGGIGLLSAVDPDDTTLAPLWQLLAVAPGTALVVAGLTVIPARLGARRPVSEILQAELA